VKVTTTLITTGNETNVVVESQLGEPNVQWLYVMVSETLKSGRIIRTYFDVGMNTKLTFLQRTFFEHEESCKRKEGELLDRYSEFNDNVHPGVPTTTFGREFILQSIENLRLDEKRIILGTE
jgi:hypothetical protein